jgi:hypothetical protein
MIFNSLIISRPQGLIGYHLGLKKYSFIPRSVFSALQTSYKALYNLYFITQNLKLEIAFDYYIG